VNPLSTFAYSPMPQPRSLGRTIFRNASANLVRLIGSGIVALLLPPFLVRALSRDVYGAWALLLQLTLYVGYFDFGIQTAVARFIAHESELGAWEKCGEIVSTSFAMLCGASVLAIAMIAALALHISNIFPQMPSSLDRSAAVALLWIGGSLALGLPVTTIHSFFVGQQRNEIPAAVVIGNRLAMTVFVVSAVLLGWGLVGIAMAIAAANVLSYVASFAMWRRWAHTIKLKTAAISVSCFRRIGGYSSAVVVWMAGSLMVSGLDLTIVGIFDYKSTAYYAIAATLTNFLIQIQGSIFAAFLPASAALGARNDAGRLGALLLSSTRYGMLILIVMGIPLVLAAHFILRLWAGADYAAHSTLLLQILVIANVIRLCALPYATFLLGTGQQSKVILSPLAEGISNLLASIVGAYYWGAIGVAIGTLIGSFVSLGLHIVYNMPRTLVITIDRMRLIKEALLRPVLCTSPFLLVLLSRYLDFGISLKSRVPLLLVSTFMTALLLWNYGLFDSERQRLTQAIRSL